MPSLFRPPWISSKSDLKRGAALDKASWIYMEVWRKMYQRILFYFLSLQEVPPPPSYFYFFIFFLIFLLFFLKFDRSLPFIILLSGENLLKHTYFHIFRPGSVHSGSASWDNCEQALTRLVACELVSLIESHAKSGQHSLPTPELDSTVCPLQNWKVKGVCI